MLSKAIEFYQQALEADLPALERAEILLELGDAHFRTGATVQAMYYCPTDKKETEKHPLHTCGTETVHIRGWKWLDNDWVNFACGAFGVLSALLLKGLF